MNYLDRWLFNADRYQSHKRAHWHIVVKNDGSQYLYWQD